MKLSLLIVFVVILVSSCKKDVEIGLAKPENKLSVVSPLDTTTSNPVDTTANSNDTTNTVQSLNDSILYTNASNVILNSVLYYYIYPAACGYVPFPSDSLVLDSLDLDADGIFDYRFKSQTQYYFQSASNPCVNYHFFRDIIGLSPTDSVGILMNQYRGVKLLSAGDTIDDRLIFFPNAPFSLTATMAAYNGFTNSVAGDKFIAVKKVTNNNTMFGWIRLDSIGGNGLIIKDFAINRADKRAIACGQTQ
jgi:hypothetical protein